MTRTLDELAAALRAVRSSFHTGPVVRTVRLARQFGLPVAPDTWGQLARRLGCALPPLAGDRAWGWGFPHGWQTVRDLAEYVAGQKSGWEPPGACSEADWREAQVFAGVRAQLVEALNLDPDEVTRQARLMADLRVE